MIKCQRKIILSIFVLFIILPLINADINVGLNNPNLPNVNIENQNKYIKQGGDFVIGNYDFNGGWLSGGLSIIDGDIYAKTGYFYNLTSLTISSLNINGSQTPVFDNLFDLGSATNQWRTIYLGTDAIIGGESVKKWLYNQSEYPYNTALHLTGDNWNGDEWITYENPNFVFNTSMLSTIYYNATQSTAVTGTIDAGDLGYTQHPDGNYDGKTLNFSEQAVSPALDLRMNFTNIGNFTNGVIRYKTSNLVGTNAIIQLWDYTAGVWEDYPVLPQTLTFVTITQPVYDDTDHIGTGTNAGVVQMRIYKSGTGNTNNHYYADWVAISKGFGTPAGQEVDPLSYHKDKNINATGFNVTADYYFGNGTQLLGVSPWLYNQTTATLTTTNTNFTALNASLTMWLYNQTTASNLSIVTAYGKWFYNMSDGTGSGGTGTFQTNKTAFWNLTATQIGIGTSTPQALLNILGVTPTISSNGISAVTIFNVTGGAGGEGSGDSAAGGAGSSIYLTTGKGGDNTNALSDGGDAGNIYLTALDGGAGDNAGGDGGSIILTSGNAGTGGSNSAGSISLLNGNVGIGNTAPVGKLDIGTAQINNNWAMVNINSTGYKLGLSIYSKGIYPLYGFNVNNTGVILVA